MKLRTEVRNFVSKWISMRNESNHPPIQSVGLMALNFMAFECEKFISSFYALYESTE